MRILGEVISTLPASPLAARIPAWNDGGDRFE
jgi:hypothetical protein